MNDTDFIERRRNERRQLGLEPSESNGERRQPRSALEESAPSTPPMKGADLRSGKDRRVAERRKQHLGPPPGMDERRFRPDLRGVVFPIYYNFN